MASRSRSSRTPTSRPSRSAGHLHKRDRRDKPGDDRKTGWENPVQSSHAARDPQPAVRVPHNAPRHRAEAGDAVRSPARTRDATYRRSFVSSAFGRDRPPRPKRRAAQPGQVVPVAVPIDKPRPAPPHRPRAPYQIYASDETGALTVTYFNARRDYLEKLFPVGGTRYVSGSAEFYDGMPQMVHPDRVVDEKGFAALPLVEPGYAPTEGISLTGARRALAA